MDPVVRALVGYVDATAIRPRPDLTARIEMRLREEAPSTAPRRLLAAVVALQAAAALRSFQQSITTALGRTASPAMVRAQAAVLVVLMVAGIGSLVGGAGFVGAGLMRTDPGPRPATIVPTPAVVATPSPFPAPRASATPQPTLRARPVATSEPSPRTSTERGAWREPATATPPTRPDHTRRANRPEPSRTQPPRIRDDDKKRDEPRPTPRPTDAADDDDALEQDPDAPDQSDAHEVEATEGDGGPG